VRDAIAQAGAVRDGVSRERLEDMLADAEARIDRLEPRLEPISRVGLENNKQSMMGGNRRLGRTQQAGVLPRPPGVACRSARDGPADALLHETVPGGAGELLVGRLRLADRLRVGLALLHEAVLGGTGKLLLGCGDGARLVGSLGDGGETEQCGDEDESFQGGTSLVRHDCPVASGPVLPLRMCGILRRAADPRDRRQVVRRNAREQARVYLSSCGCGGRIRIRSGANSGRRDGTVAGARTRGKCDTSHRSGRR
jgi:hypothetical protein